MSTVSSQEFNRDSTAVKRAAAKGPVVITDRGRPSHVLMTYEQFTAYESGNSIGDRIADVDAADLDLPLPARRRPSPSVDLDD